MHNLKQETDPAEGTHQTENEAPLLTYQSDESILTEENEEISQF